MKTFFALLTIIFLCTVDIQDVKAEELTSSCGTIGKIQTDMYLLGAVTNPDIKMKAQVKLTACLYELLAQQAELFFNQATDPKSKLSLESKITLLKSAVYYNPRIEKYQTALDRALELESQSKVEGK